LAVKEIDTVESPSFPFVRCSELLPRYQRRQEAAHGLVREAFLRGISTRRVGAVLEPVLGEAYSAQTISRILRGLDGAVQQFHRRSSRKPRDRLHRGEK